MGWTVIIGLIIEAIIKGPALIKAIREWLELIRQTPKAEVPAARRAFKKALKEEIAHLDQVALAEPDECRVDSDRPCAVTVCVKELGEKLGRA